MCHRSGVEQMRYFCGGVVVQRRTYANAAYKEKERARLIQSTDPAWLFKCRLMKTRQHAYVIVSVNAGCDIDLILPLLRASFSCRSPAPVEGRFLSQISIAIYIFQRGRSPAPLLPLLQTGHDVFAIKHPYVNDIASCCHGMPICVPPVVNTVPVPYCFVVLLAAAATRMPWQAPQLERS